MDALELLKQDHRRVLKYLDELEETSETAIKTREKLFHKIKTELMLHEKLEETVLYPAVKKYKEARALVFEAYEEHHQIDIFLKELEDVDVSSDRWQAKLTVMREDLEHHISEEEEDLFPKVRKMFNQQELENFGDEMEKIKQSEE